MSGLKPVHYLQVFFEVTGATPEQDISPVNGSVTILSGVQYSSIQIQILPDQIPEGAELYTVTITGLSAGVLDTSHSIAQFRIRASDSPYGLFGIRNPSLNLQDTGSTLNRLLSFTITRELGSTSSVLVVVAISYQQVSILRFHSPFTMIRKIFVYISFQQTR